MKAKNLFILIATFSFLVGFNSCNKEEFEKQDDSLSEIVLKSGTHTTPDCIPEVISFRLIAGRYKDAGEVTITNDGEYLIVTYTGEDGWLIRSTHLYVGSEENIPANPKGVPIPGHFPYKNRFQEPVESFTYTIPLTGLDSCIVVLAHAVVVKDDCEGNDQDYQPHKRPYKRVIRREGCSETAWADGGYNFHDYFGIKRWGYFGKYCIQECEDEKILTAKMQIIDTITGETKWAVLYTGDSPFATVTGWCYYMSVVNITGDANYIMETQNYAVPMTLGTLSIDVEGDNKTITISSVFEGSIINWSYLFYGTVGELEALTDVCPDYFSFPYSVTESALTHVYNIQ